MTTALTKKALLSLLAASAVAIATPTLAQSYGHGRGHDRGYDHGYNGGWNGGGNGGLNGEQARLAQRVDRAAYRGTISRREAQNLRWQLDEVQRLSWRYGRDGYSRWERNDLENRLDRIRYQLREDRRDGGYRDRW
jgi:hypothetical protein